MKRILFFLLLFPIIAFAQSSVDSSHGMPIVDKSVLYSEVVKVDSLNANDLYQRAKRFFVDNYKSAKNVIELDDEKNGEVTGKGVMEVYWDRGILIGGVTTNLHHTISIYVKDGRYKYEVKDLVVNYYNSGSQIGSTYFPGSDQTSPIEGFVLSKMKVHKRYVQSADLHIKSTIIALKEAMSKKIEAKKSDW